MAIHNLNSVNSNLNSFKVPFKGDDSNAISNPINSKEGIKHELASKECACATRSMAMAQILVGTDIKPHTTKKEYIEKLIKQGKIPNKDFFLQKPECGDEYYIVEVNKKGERTKEVHFYDEGNLGCSFYNPKTQQVYKGIETYDGKLHICNNDTTTGKRVSDEVYRSDGTLESNAFYKKTPEGETSPN